jgi:hypothetical protein
MVYNGMVQSGTGDLSMPRKSSAIQPYPWAIPDKTLVIYTGQRISSGKLTDAEYERALVIGIEHMLALGQLEYDKVKE